MADMIPRAAALDVISTEGGCGMCARRVLDIPAMDVAPVVHARWTTERTWKHDGEWYCSACEYEPVVFMDTAFCPHCGAKMDGET